MKGGNPQLDASTLDHALGIVVTMVSTAYCTWRWLVNRVRSVARIEAAAPILLADSLSLAAAKRP